MPAVVICLMLCQIAAASPQIATTPYGEAIDLFREGRDELAVKKLAMLMSSELIQGRDALFNALASKRPEESERAAATIGAAVLLHTARAFAAIARSNQGEFRYQLTFAQSYVDKLALRDRRAAFARTWKVLVLALLHEGRLVLAANQFARRAHDPAGDSAEFLLALGTTEEMAWWIDHEEDADPGVKGDLKDAERHYRQALILAPDLTEARLRLGRVLVLRDSTEGIKILAQLGQSAEQPYQYLAMLFEGEGLEKRGDLVEAERRYATAVSMIPNAQSANVALAHVRHARGARAEAARDVRSSASAKDILDTADPWFWYSRGTAWRATGYFDLLRSMIRP